MFTDFHLNNAPLDKINAAADPLDKTILLSILIGHFGEFAAIIIATFVLYKCVDIIIEFSQTHFDIFFISIYFLTFVIFITAIRGIGDIITIIAENKNELIIEQKNIIDQQKDKIAKQHEEILALKNEVYNLSRDLLDSKINTKQ